MFSTIVNEATGNNSSANDSLPLFSPLAAIQAKLRMATKGSFTLNLIDKISKIKTLRMQISTCFKINFHLSKSFPYISDLSTPVKAANKAVLLVWELGLNGLPVEMPQTVLIVPQTVPCVLAGSSRVCGFELYHAEQACWHLN